MDLYIAICCDRHIDEVVRVFTTQEKAVEFCKSFVLDNQRTGNDEEEQNYGTMLSDGWLYYATYGGEGDSVRVEKGTLDPDE